MSLTEQEMLTRIAACVPAARPEMYQLWKDRQHAKSVEAARKSMGAYTKHMWPDFIEGKHHRIMDDAFDRIIDGSLKRLIINMGPRFTKSEKTSWLLPSKYFGHYPDRKIIQTSHTKNLAESFGRKVRNTVDTKKYQELFPGTKLVADSKAAGKWSTDKGGTYLAIGVGGKLAGYGADLLIMDDPHSEQDYIRTLGGSSAAFDDTFEWYQTGPRQRLQPGAAIVLCMTRWGLRDMTGRLIKRMTAGGNIDQWEIIELPAVLPSGKALWPEFWSKEELEATQAGLSAQQWNAQYLQNPTSEEGAIVKREWWQLWTEPKPPKCEYVIQSWDTAYTAKETSDYSACTTWGVFYHPDDKGLDRPNIILLDAYKARLEFPDLKKKAHEMWKQRQPDAFIIEAKASGLPLIHELRAIGIPVQEFTPTRGNDKVVRLNAISDLFASGIVWAPDTRWAEEVIEEVAAFPMGEHDDLVDSTTQALLRFRQGGFIPMESDEEMERSPKRIADYY